MVSLRRRAKARNVSFRISLRWPIHIINPVDKTKLSCSTPRRRSTTVSLETYPSIKMPCLQVDKYVFQVNGNAARFFRVDPW